MRLTVLALTMLPMAAQAQTAPTPTEPLAQSQSCPAGMAWNAGLNACAQVAEKSSPIESLGMGSGCGSHGAAREVTS